MDHPDLLLGDRSKSHSKEQVEQQSQYSCPTQRRDDKTETVGESLPEVQVVAVDVGRDHNEAHRPGYELDDLDAQLARAGDSDVDVARVGLCKQKCRQHMVDSLMTLEVSTAHGLDSLTTLEVSTAHGLGSLTTLEHPVALA